LDVNDGRTYFPCDGKIEPRNRMLHGHFVLDSFLRKLNAVIKVEILSFNIFDNGKDSLARWKKASQLAGKYEVDIVLSASAVQLRGGVNIDEKFNAPGILFFASGSWGTGVGYGSWLWPQKNKTSNMILVGDAIISSLAGGKKYIYNNSLLNKDKIDFYVPLKRDRKHLFGGSSKAVAVFAAWAINKCNKQLANVNRLKNCIRQNVHLIEFVDGRNFPAI